ncbi:class I SAM-dependent methyltransferase, partial [Ramlibacter aquaticus]
PSPSFNDPLAHWNQRFAAEGFLFGTEPNAYLVAQAAHLRPGRVLCVADGEGRNSVWLARQGFAASAFELSPVAVEKARALAQSQQVQVDFHCCGWEDYAWAQAAFDNVVGIFFQFADPAARARLFQHIDQALKPGGTLLLLGYGPDQLRFKTGGPGRLENLYTEALLREAFPRYELLQLRSWEEELAEGTAHRGHSALVGLVARKPLA